MPEGGPSLGTAYLRVAGDFSQVNSQAVALFRSDRWGKLGKAAGAGLAAGLVAGGALKALYDVGEAFDEVSDKIRVQTGATGKQLKKLEGSFKNVVKAVPADFDSASAAIASLHQRLELTGKPLERLAKQFTELSRITETDLQGNVQAVTRAFGDWEIGTRKQSATLDKMFRASQASGASVSDLAEQVVQFGAPLRQVGFRLDEAVAMFASFEEAGVNTQTMMPGLRMALKNFLLEDIDPRKGLQRAFRDIESGAMSTSDALTLFGQRAGADMIEAIQQGRFELDELMKTMRDGDETIRKAGRQTMDFSEHWMKFKNNVMVALEPVATRVFKALGDAMKDVTKIIADPKLSGGEKFDAFLNLIGDAISDAIPKLIDLGGKAAGAVVKGFLNAGIWGQIAIGAVIFKMLGRSAALAPVAAAGSTIAQRLGAGIKAGLMRAGIAGVIVGGLEAVFTSGGIADTIEGQGATWGRDLAASVGESFGPVMEEAIRRRSVPALRSLTQMFNDYADQVAEVDEEASADLRQHANASQRAMERIQEKIGQVRHDIGALENTWGLSLGDIRKRTESNMRAIEESMGKHSRRGRQATSDNFLAAIEAIKNSMKSGEISAERGAKAIHRVLVKQLKSYGIRDVEGFLNRQQAALDAGGDSPMGKQRGGSLTGGKPAGDSIPIMAERGEYMLNREAVKRVGKGVLDRINFGLAPRFQKGGSLDFALGPYDIPPIQYDAGHAGGNSHVHITMTTTPAVVAIGKQLQQMGFMVGEHPAFGGVNASHSATGGHYDALAIDVNSAADETRAEVAKIARLLGGAGGGGAIGGGPARLKLPRFSSDFPLGVMVAQGLNNMAAGVERVVGERLGRREGPETPVSSGNYTGPLDRVFPSHSLFDLAGRAKLSADQVGSLASKAGLERGLFTEIASGESMFYPGIIGQDPGGTRGLGLWQITTGFNDDVIARFGGERQMFNPWVNAQAAKAIFDRQGQGAWVGYQQGGLVGHGLDEVISRIHAAEGAGDRRAISDNFLKRIKAIDVKGLDPSGELVGRLMALRTDANRFGELADRASSLSTEDTAGNLIPGLVDGKDEGHWLNLQVGALFNLRNRLIETEALVVKRRDQIAKLIDRAKKRLREVVEQIRQVERKRRELEDALQGASDDKDASQKKIQDRLDKELARPKGKRDEQLISHLRERLRSKSTEKEALREAIEKLGEKQEVNVFIRDALKGKWIPGLNTERSGLNTGRGNVLSKLSTVQGDASPMGVLSELPGMGVLGGEIFDARLRLQELGRSATAVDAGPDFEALAGVRAQKIEELEAQLALRGTQAPVVEDFFNRAPLFHEGGVVGGQGDQPIIAKGGEGIFTEEQMAAMGGTYIVVEPEAAAWVRVREVSRQEYEARERQIRRASGRGRVGVS